MTRTRPDDGRVVSNFIVQALKREDITIYGDGSQTRSFCYADDLIEGFSRLMNSQVQKPVNLGNPGEFTVRELAEQIIALTGSSSRIVYRPLSTDDPLQRRPDIMLAKRDLGWAPQIALVEGLKQMIAYFERQLVRPSGELFEDPAKYYCNNVGGIQSVLEASRLTGEGPIIFSSSCATSRTHLYQLFDGSGGGAQLYPPEAIARGT